MRRQLALLILCCSILASSCGGSADTSSAPSSLPSSAPPTTTDATPPTTPRATTTNPPSPDIAAFCRATTELNLIFVQSALTSLGGPGAQELQLLTKTPELAAASAEMARTAPPEYAGQAATLADMYETISRLADERGLSVSQLADLATDIDEDATLDELFAGLGITPADITQLFEDAAMSLDHREPPDDLLGIDPVALGCPQPDVTTGACDLLDNAELVALVGEPYTTKTTDMDGQGEQCTIEGEGIVFVDIFLAGPTFYLPTAWNEIEMIEGVGDEAFLTTGLSSPFLYAKQGNTVISVSVANADPPLTAIELSELARAALDAAVDSALDPSDAGGGEG